MNNFVKPFFLNSIHESWIPHLRDLHWTGKIDAFLGKGYASFKVTDQEKSRWNISNKDVDRIKEVLQSNIDVSNSIGKINDFLGILSQIENLNVPNSLDSKSLLIDEIKKETPENVEKLKLEVFNFVDPLLKSNFNKLAFLYKKWDGRYVQTTLLKGASLVTEFLTEHNKILKFPDIKTFENINIDVQPFMLLIYFYFDKSPEITRITLFRELLLRENERLTFVIDRIIYPSWKEYPELMFKLTQSWINALNPILIDCLVHGVEVPGRKDPQKAFNFLKPAFHMTDKNVAWIISHVTATIICADPFQSLDIIIDWMSEKKASNTKKKIISSFSDIITDKLKNKNFDQYDFPELSHVLIKIMKSWKKSEKKLVIEIANNFFSEISELNIND